MLSMNVNPNITPMDFYAASAMNGIVSRQGFLPNDGVERAFLYASDMMKKRNTLNFIA